MKMKKIFAILLTLAMILPCVCVFTTAATPAEDPTVQDVSGKTITLDGVMGADEGWAETPYVLLDNLSQAGDGRKLSGNTVDSITTDVYEKASEVRISEDGKYLYIFWQTWTANSYKIYFQVCFDGKTVKSTGSEVLAATYVIGTDNDEAFWDGSVATGYLGGSSSSWITGLNMDGKGGDLYSSAFFYKNSAFYLKNNGDGSKTVELKVPIPAIVQEKRLTQDVDVDFGAWDRVKDDSTTQGLISSEGYDWTTGFNGFTLKSAEATDVAEDPTVRDVSGKTITLDGVMGDDEGWAEKPYVLLNHVTSDGRKFTGDTVDSNTSDVYEKASEVRISEDGEYIYFFFKSWTEETARIYFQVCFDGYQVKATGSEKMAATFVIGSENAETFWDGSVNTEYLGGSSSSWVSGMNSDGKGGDLYNTEYFYQNHSFYLKKNSDGSKTIELKVVIPEAVREKRLTQDVKVAYGSWERIANGTAGLISNEGYDWTTAYNGFTLKQNAPINYAGVQISDVVGETYGIRLVSVLNSLDYDAVGYRMVVTYNGKTSAEIEKTSAQVYEKLIAGTNSGVNEEITPDKYGGTYFHALSLYNILSNAGNVTLLITPFVMDGEVKINGSTYKIVVNNGVLVENAKYEA